MSCDDCRKAQETDESIYYRLDNADIAIKCCPKHFRMLRARLMGQTKATWIEGSMWVQVEFIIGAFLGAAVAVLSIGFVLWLLA